MVHARIDDGTLAAAAGPLPGADLIIETGPAIEALMSGEMTPAAAIASGSVQLTGDADRLERFVALVQIAPQPPVAVSLTSAD